MNLTPEQWISAATAIGAVVLGGGGLAALLGVFVTRKLGIKTSENEANRDMNSTWDAIVENLQSQIDTQTKNFTDQIKELHAEVASLKTGHRELEEALGRKERLILKAIAHINRLEALILPNDPPKRPEGLE